MCTDMLIICDFDGTVTARDTNSALARRFAPDAYAQLEGRLASRDLTLREVLAAEFEGIDIGLQAVLSVALTIPFRPGFTELLDAVERDGSSFVLLSSGFREIIEPMLAREGHLGRVELVANSITLDENGGHITWRDQPACELCGEPCKRSDVGRLADRHRATDGNGDDRIVFIGDGFSDRCGAESADRVLARDSLASYLDDRSIHYEPWQDFVDVRQILGLAPAGLAR